MKLNQLKNKKILILGFGREGMSSYKFLRRHFRNQKIGVADEKTLPRFDAEYRKILKKDKNLVLNLGKNYLKALDRYEVIVKTPGIKLSDKLIRKLKNKGIILTSNLNIFLSHLKGKIIGITGSKGKGTTATLLYKILKAGGKRAYLVGNIGQAFLDFIHKDSKNTIYVAEISSFHLDMIQGKLDIAVMLSFFPEHLKEHGTVSNYFQAKMNIVRHLKKGGVLIYNSELKKVANFLKKIEVKKIAYNKHYLSLRAPIYRGVAIPRQDASKTGSRRRFAPRDDIKVKLLGEHNLLNISAAIQVAKLFKIKDEIILKVVSNFKGLPYRLEYVGKYKGIKFYCDTLGTTPESTIEAIKALKPATLIVGGSAKGASQEQFKKLAREIIKSKVKTLVALPNEGERIAKLINKQKTADKLRVVKVKNMRQAVELTYKYTRANQSAVLSPAAASFDQYKDYAEKGEDFKKWVKKLSK